jgi:hypothetical protein
MASRSHSILLSAVLTALWLHGCAPSPSPSAELVEARPAPALPPVTTPTHERARDDDAALGASSGYQSSEALLARMRSLEPGAESGELLAPAFTASTPDGQRFRAILVELFPAAYEVQAAMMDEFGEPLAPSTIMNLDQFPPHLSQGTVVEESSDKVIYEITQARGHKERIGLVRRGDSWWIDLDEMSEQRRQSLPMLEKMVPAFVDASGDFTSRVLRGEFATAGQANAAMQRSMAESMMSRMGVSGSVPTGSEESDQ